MRTSLITVLIALGLLAGCNNAAPPPAPAPKQIADTVSGTILLREPRALGADAHVDLKVVDVAHPENPLAQITIAHTNQPPIAFSVPIDTSQVDPHRAYAVDATLVDGERRYLPLLQYPVLTNNAPSKVQIILAPEPTAAEKMFEAYKKAFAEIGTLKSVNGSAMLEHSTVAWDAFYTNGKVRVVREVTDQDNNQGETKMRMAYKDGKPWVVVKEDASGPDARPFSTIKVGWDDKGKLVLKDKMANGQTGTVSPEEARSIYAHARQALQTAEAKLPRH